MNIRTFQRNLVGTITFVLALTVAKPLAAHHSFDTEYDSKKAVTLSGVVTRLDWTNPHAFVTIEFKDPSGAVKSYKVEMGPPYALVRQGWKKEMVKIGDKITIEGACLAKDGSDSAGSENTTHMILASGQKLAM